VSTWHYENAAWTETTFLDDAWGDGDGWDDVMKRLGYEHYMGVGSDATAFEVQVYRRKDAPKFIVTFSDGNLWDSMTAGSLPAAMDLLARYAPIVTASVVSDVISDIRNVESFGIVTDVLSSAELNRGAVAARVADERRERDRRRREARERKSQRMHADAVD